MTKPKAFILMPFANEFTEIYNLFIASTLDDIGYEVFRADDILSQQNILQDIVSSIISSDLIVADLTGSNPNVYYELGLAHALRKPVILLTQSISELPFDLRPYRVVSYNTHFAAVIKAKKELADLAKGAIEGTVPFGNPVTDFAPNASSIGIKKAINDEESEEAGFLDHLVLLEENSSELVQILVDIGNQTDELNKYTENATEEIGRINASSNPNKAKRLQSLLHEMGDRQIEYANVISDLNDKYSELLKRYETSLEFIVTFQKPSTAAEKDQLRTLLVSLSGLENSSINARESFSRMAMALDELPKMERHLNRAKQHASREIKRFADNTDQTVAIASRVRGVGERILRDSSITLLASQS